MQIKSLEHLKKCDCGRSWCKYYDALNDRSYNIDMLKFELGQQKENIEIAKKNIKIIQKVLKAK